jgi:hypothetical protein
MNKLLLKSLVTLIIVSCITNCNENNLNRRYEPAPSAGLAIGRPDEPNKPTVKDGNQKPQGPSIDSTCLPRIKSQILSRQLLFIDDAKSNIDNSIVPQTNQKISDLEVADQNYSVTKLTKSSALRSLQTMAWSKLKKGQPWNSYSVSISTNNKDSIDPYSLKISYSSFDSQGRPEFELNQHFNISKTCEQNFRSTKLIQFEFKTKDHFKVHQSEFFPDTGDKETNKDFSLETGEFLYSMGPRLTKADLKVLRNPKLRLYSDTESPLQKIKIDEVNDNFTIKNDFTHNETKGTQIKISILSDDTKVASDEILDALPVSYKQTILNNEIIEVDQALWLKMTPEEQYTGSQYVQVKIPGSALENNDPIKLNLTYNKDLDLKIIEPYWKIISKSEAEAHLESLQTFDNESASLDSPVNSESKIFLKDTQYIQTKLSKIKNWSEELKKDFKGTRLEMATKILKLISTILVYDHEMIKNNIVRPLKTEEILSKKNGVCQHFANLFTTLARAVGLPTRIITGYLLLENSAGPHAWVEIELKPGLWRPIEPQKTELEFKLKKYFPIAVSAVLDNPKNANLQAKELQAFTSLFKLELEN